MVKNSNDYFPLFMEFHVNPERCDNPEYYREYLLYNAELDFKQGMGITYIYVDQKSEDDKKVMGYITLRNSSLVKDEGESKKYGYSALEIVQLAVDAEYEGQDIGTDMVKDAINIAQEINDNYSSIKYIVLCATPQAEGFYTREPLCFQKIYDNNDDIPREHRNLNCIPMYLQLR